MVINTRPLSIVATNIGGGLSFLLPAGRGGYDGNAAAVAVTAFAGIALVAAIWYTRRGHVSPWSLGRRKRALSQQEWRSLFTPDGKLHDGGVDLLKKVRNGGIDPSIREEVWPFLLGIYDLHSSESERGTVKKKRRREYEKLRRQCKQSLEKINENSEPKMPVKGDTEDVINAQEPFSTEKENAKGDDDSDNSSSTLLERSSGSSQVPSITPSRMNSDSSDSGSSEDEEVIQSPGTGYQDGDSAPSLKDETPSIENGQGNNLCRTEDFSTWQRIIRLDAVRTNAEWIAYSPSKAAAVSDERARLSAEAVQLTDYNHLEPCRILHAARLVAILEVYAIYDSEIGYCQGMSDLLSPIIAVIEEDYLAFWCFVGFMKKARHNFRLDEVGIKRQLNIVSKIIKSKDSRLYGHLVKLQAEDCFFVYRMVVVVFRRELTFEQTLCLWEVMWADQTAIRAGVGKSEWGRIRQPAPPTEDLLLYAIAASVLQRRKEIIEKYSSMDEILRECNDMSGRLDVWKLLDDAHGLVITLHDKIES